RREAPESLQQVADAEIAQRAAEIDRRQMAFPEGLQLERLAGLGHELEFVLDRRDGEIGIIAREIGEIDLLCRTRLGAAALQQTDGPRGDTVPAVENAAQA